FSSENLPWGGASPLTLKGDLITPTGLITISISRPPHLCYNRAWGTINRFNHPGDNKDPFNLPCNSIKFHVLYDKKGIPIIIPLNEGIQMGHFPLIWPGWGGY